MCVSNHVGKLTAASPVLVARLSPLTTMLCCTTAMTHSPLISQIDTVRAYYSGPRIIVEVDVVMDPDATLRATHDVAEELQSKLESLPDVERAYVHVDYETSHKPVCWTLLSTSPVSNMSMVRCTDAAHKQLSPWKSSLGLSQHHSFFPIHGSNALTSFSSHTGTIRNIF